MLAVIKKANEGYTARFDREFKQSPAELWAWLTDNARLAQWFPELRVEELREGGTILFDMHNGTFEKMTITALLPQAVIAYTWGEDAVRFEIAPQSSGSSLVLTETLHRLTAHTPKDLAGWHVCLDVIRVLADGQNAGFRKEVWNEWHDHYIRAVEEAKASAT